MNPLGEGYSTQIIGLAGLCAYQLPFILQCQSGITFSLSTRSFSDAWSTCRHPISIRVLPEAVLDFVVFKYGVEGRVATERRSRQSKHVYPPLGKSWPPRRGADQQPSMRRAGSAKHVLEGSGEWYLVQMHAAQHQIRLCPWCVGGSILATVVATWQTASTPTDGVIAPLSNSGRPTYTAARLVGLAGG